MVRISSRRRTINYTLAGLSHYPTEHRRSTDCPGTWGAETPFSLTLGLAAWCSPPCTSSGKLTGGAAGHIPQHPRALRPAGQVARRRH